MAFCVTDNSSNIKYADTMYPYNKVFFFFFFLRFLFLFILTSLLQAILNCIPIILYAFELAISLAFLI